MTKLQRIILALSSGILLSLAWYEWGSPLLLFVGFIPFLVLEEDMARHRADASGWNLYYYGAIVVLTWNLLDTWWIKNASYAGLLAALLVSGVLMSFPFMLYALVKRKFGRVPGYASFIVFWLACEFAYTHGEIAWPWLTLGNGFLYSVRWVQWYEYTGVFGGSLWVLLVNVLLYDLLWKKTNGIAFKQQRLTIVAVFLVLLLPAAGSYLRYAIYRESGLTREVVVVQPNIDPYMKFNDMPSIEQTRIQIEEARHAITDSTTWVLAPETSICGSIWIGYFDQVPDFLLVKHLVKDHPQISYITGIMCYRRYEVFERTATSNPLGNTGYYYDSYNSAIQLDTTPEIPIYHKSKLVTGVEKMPYTWLFAPLKGLMLDLGGIFRTHGTQLERDVFQPANDSLKIGPVICYESVFGEFVTEYIHKGANYLFVITNDGWWGNTPGHRQHNALASLRAIETRRSIARSANTGISSMINQRGDVLMEMGWWKRGTLRDSLRSNDALTFYVKHGDYLGRSAFFLAVVLLLLLVVNPLLRRRLTASKS